MRLDPVNDSYCLSDGRRTAVHEAFPSSLSLSLSLSLVLSPILFSAAVSADTHGTPLGLSALSPHFLYSSSLAVAGAASETVTESGF